MGHVIETDEAGRLVLPAEILGDSPPHSRYKVETLGNKLVVEPEASEEQRRQTYQDWLEGWKELSKEIGNVWPAGLSAVDAVSEQRR